MDWIEELDDLLAIVEDTAKGSEGDMITKARGMIQEQRLKAGQHETDVVCEKRRKEALDKVEREYYDINSPHYKDNERYKWAINKINEPERT